MRQVNSDDLAKLREQQRFKDAEHCAYIAEDLETSSISVGGSALWHHLVCVHPDRPNPLETGRYAHCDYVWRGFCPYPSPETVNLAAISRGSEGAHDGDGS